MRRTYWELQGENRGRTEISENFGSTPILVALGIVVDDTTHLLVATQRRLASTPDAALAVQGAVAEVGPQITLTNLVIIGSMGILALGSFAPAVHFGTITLMVVIVALLADLLILPRLLCAAHRKRRWLGRSAS